MFLQWVEKRLVVPTLFKEVFPGKKMILSLTTPPTIAAVRRLSCTYLKDISKPNLINLLRTHEEAEAAADADRQALLLYIRR